jgi:hypothetical protein
MITVVKTLLFLLLVFVKWNRQFIDTKVIIM